MMKLTVSELQPGDVIRVKGVDCTVRWKMPSKSGDTTWVTLQRPDHLMFSKYFFPRTKISVTRKAE